MDPDLKNLSLLIATVLVVSACQSITVMSTPVTRTEAAELVFTATPSITITPTSTSTQLLLNPTRTEKVFQVCCPLEEETFESLPLIISKPLLIPSFGRDDGHHGVDFANFSRGDRESIQGIDVYAILSGITVLTLEDNTPYGYTILVETPLSYLPEDLQEMLTEAYQPVPEDVHYQGECPQINPPEITSDLSLYHLYAHLEEPPTFTPGDPVECAAYLGRVGNTGRSSNPHLHLETRLGPSGAEIGNMAYYETQYTVQQRANYCLWRMSGYFQLVDPFLIINYGR